MKKNIITRILLFIAGIHIFVSIIIPFIINENNTDITGIKLSAENVNYLINTTKTMTAIICVLCLKTFFEISIKHEELVDSKKKKHKNNNKWITLK